MKRRLATVCSIAAVIAAGLSTSAQHAAATPGTTTIFNVGTGQTFTVPPGVTSITVVAYGAEGGDGSPNAKQGGLGGGVHVPSLTVTPNEVLQVNVGGLGGTQFNAGGAGGVNGGGHGGPNTNGDAGGGGGGASDVRRSGNRLVVAGGGGGGAANQCNQCDGRGGAGGQSGFNGGGGNLGANGGSSGGNGGTGGNGHNGSAANGDFPGPSGSSGTAAGVGGAGGGVGTSPGTWGAGGGGGGGVTGGGGGGANGDGAGALALHPAQAPGSGGGGGGNSTGPTGTTYENGVRSGDGLVKIIAGDTDGPAVTITSPSGIAAIGDTTPTISGNRGTDQNDLAPVLVSIYQGGSVDPNNLIQTISTSTGGATYSVDANQLQEGTYTAQAQETDESGNVGSSDPVTFTIDTTGPTVTITSPTNNSHSSDTSPTFTGSAELFGSQVTIHVVDIAENEVQSPSGSIDGTGNFSVDATGPLSDGMYTAYATQNDQAGNPGQSATITFTVDTQAPDTTITKHPKKKTTKRSATFEFSSSEVGGTFECNLDGAGFSTCISGVHFTGLSKGTHTFEVRAIDAALNVDLVPATWSWKVVKR